MQNKQLKIPATYMRGGTSKGVFFKRSDLPKAAQIAGEYRDKLLLRIIGSPDPYSTQIDGMGGATSSTSKTVIIDKSTQPGHDVDYLFGQVAIDKAMVDWSGNCGNLTAAVGAFAINNGLVDNGKIPVNGTVEIKIWQVNIGKTIIAHVPIINGEVQELGDFYLDGVAFPAAEVKIEFIEPVSKEEAIFPTGNLVDDLTVDGVGSFSATMINAGIPTVFINAQVVGLTGTELREDINNNPELLAVLETIRLHGAVKMGLVKNLSQAATSHHTPKLALVAPAQGYLCSSGEEVSKSSINLCVRALSMGKLHHAMMGTAAVAIGAAAVIPGTLVNQAANSIADNQVCFGHPAGTLTVGADTEYNNDKWQINKVVMSRSARRIMEGCVFVPGE